MYEATNLRLRSFNYQFDRDRVEVKLEKQCGQLTNSTSVEKSDIANLDSLA